MQKKKFKIDWGNAMDKIKNQENSSKNSFKDERVYYPQFNENGTAQAIIRFLPSPDTEIPFINVFSHSIKGPGGWYIENCPTTLKNECPVCKANSSIWDSDPDTARSRKRKYNYYSNILVVKDPKNPENENKVFLFKYGFKIHQKIMEKLQPEEGGVDEPIMIFDYYDGTNFKLSIKKVQVGSVKMPNYDSSEFQTPCEVGTDEEIEKISKSLYSLADFNKPENFKPYVELESKFNRVVGVSKPRPVTPKAETSTVENTEVDASEESVFDGDENNFFDKLKNEE